MKADRVKIAVIGPTMLVEQVLAIRGKFPTVEVLPFPYQAAQEAGSLCLRAGAEAEAILFTGPVGYRQAMREHRPGVPTLYIPYSPMWLYPALYKVPDRRRLSRVSVDTMDPEVVEVTYRELELPLEALEAFQYQGLADPEQVVEFHLRLLQHGTVWHALTCLLDVYRRLQELGLSCSWLVPSRVAMEEALEKALYLAEGARARGTQIVVGLVRVRLDEKGLTPFEQQRLRLRAQELLLSHVEEADGHLVDCGGGEYQFFTTRALFEKVTCCYSRWPLLESLPRAGFPISVGVGFGTTASEAGLHARAALEEAMRRGDNSCYVMLENKRLIGPLGPGKLSYDLRISDPRLLEISRQLGMAAASVNRIGAALAQLGEEFTAHELAGKLRVGLRTSHRVLQKLLAAGYVREVGQENAGSRGRPKRLFRVTKEFLAQGG